jgi:aminocyclitol acetyltransferase
MKTRLEQVLDRCLNGREVAVWGNPTRLMLRALKSHNYCIAGNVDPQKNYVVAVNDDDLSDFLLDEQSKPFKYVDDYLTFNDEGGELPFESECFGVKVGRQTYFGEGIADACRNGYVESIGRFTSINSSAMIHVDHPSNMTFISDEIQNFFTEENKALFKARYLVDPKHPYAANKSRLSIGNDVWIGANTFINCSRVTTIGDGAIIGSGAVVLEDVPPYAVVVGVPAKIKRYRYPVEMIETLLRVKWWEWSIEEINANADALMSPEIFLKKFGR